ncbi:MAG: hypothetical protein ACK44O_16265 [Novosphingobium sp.]|jgi:hypothetical protein|uniref:hypothetical protein n=1 Tax=Novosphingobium sp. TaxID=1874826 RepID=UPI00391BAD79
MDFIKSALLLAAFAIPAAVVWAIVFMLARHSRTKRLLLLAAIFLLPVFWWETGALILLVLALPATIVTVWLFEWAAAKDAI